MKGLINGDLKEVWGEYALTFDNEFGRGVIKGMGFDWGLTYLDFEVSFIEHTEITFNYNLKKVVDFLFISEGHLGLNEEDPTSTINLNRYQNVIASNKAQSKKTFIFSKAIQIKVNLIQLNICNYKKKKNNNLSSLNGTLQIVFDDHGNDNHLLFGNYSLKVADEVKLLKSTCHTGITRTLFIEGQLNLIMAMQLQEHQNAQRGKVLLNSLSLSHIEKIRMLSAHMAKNVSEPLPIEYLSILSGLGSKKLQLGFRVLYSKTVNEYVRDLKLEIARDQLKDFELSISEIVYGIGYKSRSYFSKMFFARYGILPKDYRGKFKKAPGYGKEG